MKKSIIFLAVAICSYVTGYGYYQKDIAAKLKDSIEFFSRKTNNENQFHIDFVGTANLQQNISNAKEEVQGSAGLGVIFERYFLDKDQTKDRKRIFESLDIEAFINVASSLDTLVADVSNSEVTNQRTFGTYILNPVSPKQSVFFNANVFFNTDFQEENWWLTSLISGANVRFNASNILWSLNDQGNRNDLFGGAISYRIGVFHEFIPNNKIRNEKNQRKYSVRVGLAYSARHLAGDISSGKNRELRSRFLGTTDQDFSGIEPFFGFRLNNIIAEFTVPTIGGRNKSDIEGLTDTQFLFSVRFVGGFSLKLENDKKSTED